MRAVTTASSLQYQSGFRGRKTEVLWESASGLGPKGWQMEGLTDTYIRVRAFSPDNIWNQINTVVLEEQLDSGFLGIIQK